MAVRRSLQKVSPIELIEVCAKACGVLRGRQSPEFKTPREGVWLAPDCGTCEFVMNGGIARPYRGDESAQRAHRLLLANAMNEYNCLLFAHSSALHTADSRASVLARFAWNKGWSRAPQAVGAVREEISKTASASLVSGSAAEKRPLCGSPFRPSHLSRLRARHFHRNGGEDFTASEPVRLPTHSGQFIGVAAPDVDS